MRLFSCHDAIPPGENPAFKSAGLYSKRALRATAFIGVFNQNLRESLTLDDGGAHMSPERSP